MNKFQEDVLEQMVMWIMQNIHSPLRIDDISLRSGYSKFHIQRLFYKYTGMTIAKYIREVKFKYAREALEKTDVPIGMIALEFGYDSQQTFTRAFNQRFKMPPGKWRGKVKASSTT